MISFVAGGGAREIGASFYVLRLGGQYIGIDCGVRPNPGGEKYQHLNPLPDFSVCPRLDYLFITHGHLDHVGATPCLLKKFEGLKVYMTAPTHLLALLHWEETLKIAERTKQTAPFNSHELDIFLRTIQRLEVNQELDFGEFSVKAVPAGHILGAVSLIFSYRGKKIFASGDISFQDQETIEGAKIDCQADFLISEATYAGRKRADRRAETQRFLDDVTRVITNQGQVLIPASIFRAPEIFEMLSRNGVSASAPIYLDGAAKRVTAIYREFLPGRIQAGIEKSYVSGWKQRKEIFEQRPCIVIASSATLTDGISGAYARRWLSDSRNAILFPGYLDPCSTGYETIRSQPGNKIRLKDRFGEIRSFYRHCEVVQYYLSTHADGEELRQMRRTIKPRMTILVHGKSNNISRAIWEEGRDGSIIGPKNGEGIVLD